MLGLIASALIASSTVLPVDEPLPFDDVKLHAWGVEFTGSDGNEWDREVFVFDPIGFELAIESDPITIDDCLATAQIACAATGIKRFYYRTNPVTGEVTCEFECFPGTGGGE